jgi:hypothetical protein
MRICVLALSTVLCLPASMKADTIFSNFGPGNPYSTIAGADIGGMAHEVQVLAVPFSPNETAVLSDVEIPLVKLTSNAPSFSLYPAPARA